MIDKKASTSVPIHDLIATRWSSRAIDPHQPVAREHLAQLLEAARWAPSCYGDQPWRYLVWDKLRSPEAWQKAFECLVPGNQSWAKMAPVLMLSLARNEFMNGKPNRWGQHDTGAASENLCLQGASLGLVVHQMGGFDAQKARDYFNIPGQYTPMAMIAAGHPGDASHLSEKHRATEDAPRQRLDVDQIAFEAEWGSPFKA